MSEVIFKKKNNHDWREQWNSEHEEWWEFVVGWVAEEERWPSWAGVRKSWKEQGFNPDLLPTQVPLKRALGRELRDRGIDLDE